MTDPGRGAVLVLLLSCSPVALCEETPGSDTPVIAEESTGLERFVADQAAAITAIESYKGSRHLSLTEGLLTLGLGYQLLDRHVEAINSLNRALYVRRANTGLYDRGQVEIIAAMIRSAAALGDWEEVDNLYQHIEFIYRRNYDLYDPAWLPVLKQLYEWNIDARYLNTGQHPDIHDYQADDILQYRREIIERNREALDLSLCDTIDDECCEVLPGDQAASFCVQ